MKFSYAQCREIIKRFREFCGEEEYSKFVEALPKRISGFFIGETKPRLRYWQERIWERFAEKHQLELPTNIWEIVEIFEKGSFVGKVFKIISRTHEEEHDIEIYQCIDEPDLELHLTYVRNVWLPSHHPFGAGPHVGEIRWKILRGGKVIWSGTDELDWFMSDTGLGKTISWKEQVERRIGKFVMEEE